MKRTIYSVLMAVTLLTASTVLTGCKKDQNSPDQPANAATYRMRVTASKGTDAPLNGPRKVLSSDGTTLNAAWAAGERVSVYNATKGSDLGGYLEAQSSGANVQLDGNLTGTIEAGDRLTLRFLSPAYTNQQGTLAYISSNCDYAVAENVEVTSVNGGTIYTSGEAAFVSQQAIIRFTLKDAADGTTLLSPSSLTLNDGTSDIATLTSIPATTYTTNGEGVLYAAVPGFSGKDITLTVAVGADTYTYEKSNAALTNGGYYKMTIEMTKQASSSPSSGIGLFSVGATTKVMFAPGNLQYNAALGSHQCVDGTTKQGTWRFAEHQWDMVGMGYGQTDMSDDYRCYIGGTVTNSDNRNISSTYNGWIDLFGWGTSGWNNTANDPYAVNYEPWSTSSSTVSGKYNTYGYGPSLNQTDKNLTGTSANYDWGVYNQIGEDAPGSWRTLTKDEWVYLYSGRTNASNKYGAAKVNGITGVVILPDEWTLPTGCSFTSGMTSPSKWYDWSLVAGTNTYTAAQWALMEAQGAVFLPAAGQRDGTTVNYAGTYGNYWSSVQDVAGYVYDLYFNPMQLRWSSSDQCYGRSVRLVRTL